MATTTTEANVNMPIDGTENAPLQMFKIQSKDGQVYEVDENVIKQLSAVKEMCELLNVDGATIPLPNVTSTMLVPIIEYCDHHKNDPKTDATDNNDDDDDDPNKDIYEPKRSDDISEWDMKFISRFTVSDGTLFEMIMAANYLGIKPLIAVGCKTIANMVRGKPSTEVREIFNISYDPPGEGINAPTAIENSSNPTPAN